MKGHRRGHSLSLSGGITTAEKAAEAEAKYNSLHIVQIKEKNVDRKKYKVKKGQVVVKGTYSFDLMTAIKLGIDVGVMTCHKQGKNQVDLQDFGIRNCEVLPSQTLILIPIII